MKSEPNGLHEPSAYRGGDFVGDIAMCIMFTVIILGVVILALAEYFSVPIRLYILARIEYLQAQTEKLRKEEKDGKE